ncbi:MAG: PP2C family protein-serine/threonine phosphatase, partial [bacterium]
KEKERLEGELEAARAIQLRLLPETMPQLPGFQIAAASKPAKQVGGDYYDFLLLPNGQMGLAVGDVSGKGMPAALLMANLQASLRTLIEVDLPPSELIRRLNRVLHASSAPEMFATFFYGQLDRASAELTYVNAGHNPPLICGNGRLEPLSEGGLILGILPDGIYQQGFCTLHSRELLVLYSDGITEAMNSTGEEFGEQRLIRLLENHCQQDADSVLRATLQSVEEFCSIPQDDVTLMIIKRL